MSIKSRRILKGRYISNQKKQKKNRKNNETKKKKKKRTNSMRIFKLLYYRQFVSLFHNRIPVAIATIFFHFIPAYHGMVYPTICYFSCAIFQISLTQHSFLFFFSFRFSFLSHDASLQHRVPSVSNGVLDSIK